MADATAAPTERAAALASLRESGAAQESWDGDALAVFDGIARSGVAVADRGCFIAGCGATLTFPAGAELAHALDQLQAAPTYRAWTGGKRLTRPEPGADGRISLALILYRPD